MKWLEDGDRKLARKVKIEALRGLAAREYNAPNRNYYLSYANELESGQLSEIWFQSLPVANRVKRFSSKL